MLPSFPRESRNRPAISTINAHACWVWALTASVLREFFSCCCSMGIRRTSAHFPQCYFDVRRYAKYLTAPNFFRCLCHSPVPMKKLFRQHQESDRFFVREDNVLQCYSVTVPKQVVRKSKIKSILIYIIIYINIGVFSGYGIASRELSHCHTVTQPTVRKKIAEKWKIFGKTFVDRNEILLPLHCR